MAQIFPRWTNYIPHVLTVGAPIAGVVAIFAVWYWFSPWYTDVGYTPNQPVAYSHKLHVGDLGIDCRYCHNTVEVGARAAVPPTETCMNCHVMVRPDSKKLELIRTAHAASEPVPWVRVHQLPDYAFFDHSVHLASGVGCVSCHGRVDQMVEVVLSKPLSMGWCLDCHFAIKDAVAADSDGGAYADTKAAAMSYLRPVDKVTDLAYDPTQAGYDPMNDPHRTRPASELKPPQHCSGCHR